MRISTLPQSSNSLVSVDILMVDSMQFVIHYAQMCVQEAMEVKILIEVEGAEMQSKVGLFAIDDSRSPPP
jgi:hypothetical protein